MVLRREVSIPLELAVVIDFQCAEEFCFISIKEKCESTYTSIQWPNTPRSFVFVLLFRHAQFRMNYDSVTKQIHALLSNYGCCDFKIFMKCWPINMQTQNTEMDKVQLLKQIFDIVLSIDNLQLRHFKLRESSRKHFLVRMIFNA